ncbi:MAG: Hpt domain-containing protein [Eubacteriales bacterium]|jgi:two-component system sensor histidine kinase/response regulator
MSRHIGIHHYISKPFNPDYFIETVKSIILSRDTGGGTAMPVLDRKKGLENTGGGKELYNKVLLEYYGENLDTADRLAAAVREKRYDDAAQIVHKVKSSSASIGAKTLAETAASLQSALAEKDESEILTLCERFSDILGKLLAEIEKTKENQN